MMTGHAMRTSILAVCLLGALVAFGVCIAEYHRMQREILPSYFGSRAEQSDDEREWSPSAQYLTPAGRAYKRRSTIAGIVFFIFGSLAVVVAEWT